MSDELVEGLVLAAQTEMKAYREAAYDDIRGEIRVLGTILELTDGAAVRQTGLSLLERLTRPILRDIAVELVRAILRKYRISSVVTVTQSWLDTLPLDRSRLEDKSGLDPQGIDHVLRAMFRLLLTSKNVAEHNGLQIRLFPAPKETHPPDTELIYNCGVRSRSETIDQGRSQADRGDPSKTDAGNSRQRAAEDTAPPASGSLRNRRRR